MTRARSRARRIWRQLVAWAFPVLALGCTGYAPAEGVTAAPELYEACTIAAERWAEATGLLPTCDAGRPMVAGNVRGTPAGHTDGKRVTIETGRLECLDLFVAHELGHVLAGGGDGDHPRHGELMAAQPSNCGVPLNEADLDFVCEARGDCAWRQPEEEQ